MGVLKSLIVEQLSDKQKKEVQDLCLLTKERHSDRVELDRPLPNTKAYFLGYQEDELVFFSVIFLNPLAKWQQEAVLCLGSVRMLDAVASSGLPKEQLNEYARTQGVGYVFAPINGSTWEHYRLRTDAEKAHFFLDTFQPIFYKDLFYNAGFEAVSKYASFELPLAECSVEGLEAQRQEFANAGIKLRFLDLEKLEHELEALYELCTSGFSENFFYTGIDKPSFIEKYMAMKPILRQEHVLLAESLSGRVEGALFCIPDLMQANRLIFKTIVKRSDSSFSMLGTQMAEWMSKKAYLLGYRKLLFAFMKDDSKSIRFAQRHQGQALSQYELLAMKVK